MKSYQEILNELITIIESAEILSAYESEQIKNKITSSFQDLENYWDK